MESSKEDIIGVLFNMNDKTIRINVKTKDSRKQLKVGEFKHFVHQKLKSNFTDELDHYVWKVYDKKLKKYLWANDNVIINDNDKVQASIKEVMTMTVIKPTISRNGSQENVEKYEVEIKDKRAIKNSKSQSTNSSHPAVMKNVNGVSTPKVNTIKANTPQNNETNSGASTPKNVDIKPILMKLVKRYNEEFKWIAEKAGESNFENDNYDGVWDLIAGDINEKVKSDHVYEYEEVKQQFGLLMSLYLSILSATNASNVESWQFFNIFHEMDLTPFVKNIGELRRNFEGISEEN